MAVERSIRDAVLAGPFLIDLLIAPTARGLGPGNALLDHAIRVCAHAGDPRLSLRFGEGTSDAAMTLYRRSGFLPLEQD